MNEIAMKEIYAKRRNLSGGGSGVIIADTGYGKTYSMLKEIEWVMNNTDDTVYLIGPANEYRDLTSKFMTTIIKLSDQQLNPLELPKRVLDMQETVAHKTEFVMSIARLLLGNLTNLQKSLIDQILRNLYTNNDSLTWNRFVDEFKFELEKFDNNDVVSRLEGVKKDLAEINLYMGYAHEVKIPQEETYNAIKALTYCLEVTKKYIGSNAMPYTFIPAYRLVIYDTNEVSHGLMDVNRLIAIEDIRSRIIDSPKTRMNSRLYIEDADRLFENAPDVMSHLYRRSRKQGLIITSLLTSLEHLSDDRIGCSILASCNYVELAHVRRDTLAIVSAIFNLNDHHKAWLEEVDRRKRLIICNNEVASVYLTV